MAYRKPYPPEMRSRVFDMIFAGKTYAEITAATGIQSATLYRWRKQACLPKLSRKFDDETRHAAIMMRKRGVSPQVIARKIGAHYSTVMGWLKAAGLTKPHSPKRNYRAGVPYSDAEKQTILQELKDGATVRSIREKYGTAPNTLKAWRGGQTLHQFRNGGTDPRIAPCKAYAESDRTMQCVADEYGIKMQTLAKWIQRYFAGKLKE